MNDIATRKEHKAMSAEHIAQTGVLRDLHFAVKALTERIKGRQGD